MHCVRSVSVRSVSVHMCKECCVNIVIVCMCEECWVQTLNAVCLCCFCGIVTGTWNVFTGPLTSEAALSNHGELLSLKCTAKGYPGPEAVFSTSTFPTWWRRICPLALFACWHTNKQGPG